MSKAEAELDLTVARVIKAPRAAVWDAWADPGNLAQWWLPAPASCRVVDFELVPGGAFRTEMDEGDGFMPHMDGCFLAVDELERLVFTTALTAGWRPSGTSFMTGVITFADHPEGTAYEATAMHKDGADRDRHLELGFEDGWGTVTRQLAELVEARP